MTDTPSPSLTMRSLERALDVLGVLERTRKPLRLTDIARESRLHIATTQRILSVLQQHGYVAQEPGGYTIGVTALANAHGYLVSSALPQISTPILRDLAAATSLTASISVPVDLGRVLIGRIDGPRPLRYQLPIGQRLPIHVGAGRVVAALLPERDLSRLIAEVIPFRLPSGEAVSEMEFRSGLAQVRDQGYVFSSGERTPGAASIGAPVLDSEGHLTAMLQIAGQIEDVRPGEIERYVAEISQAASAIGYQRS